MLHNLLSTCQLCGSNMTFHYITLHDYSLTWGDKAIKFIHVMTRNSGADNKQWADCTCCHHTLQRKANNAKQGLMWNTINYCHPVNQHRVACAPLRHLSLELTNLPLDRTVHIYRSHGEKSQNPKLHNNLSSLQALWKLSNKVLQNYN